MDRSHLPFLLLLVLCQYARPGVALTLHLNTVGNSTSDADFDFEADMDYEGLLEVLESYTYDGTRSKAETAEDRALMDKAMTACLATESITDRGLKQTSGRRRRHFFRDPDRATKITNEVYWSDAPEDEQNIGEIKDKTKKAAAAAKWTKIYNFLFAGNGYFRDKWRIRAAMDPVLDTLDRDAMENGWSLVHVNKEDVTTSKPAGWEKTLYDGMVPPPSGSFFGMAPVDTLAINREVLKAAFGIIRSSESWSGTEGGYCWGSYCIRKNGAKCGKGFTCNGMGSHEAVWITVKVPEKKIKATKGKPARTIPETTEAHRVIKGSSTHETYCSGHTLWTALKVAQAEGLTKHMTSAEASAFQGTWYGWPSYYHPDQSVKALDHFKMGETITNNRDVRPGDFVQMNKESSVGNADSPFFKGKIRRGHSVMFLHWIFKDDDDKTNFLTDSRVEPIGFTYWGSQTATRGPGVQNACWTTTDSNLCMCKCSDSCIWSETLTAFGRMKDLADKTFTAATQEIER